MTNSEIFKTAHAEARAHVARYKCSYREAFAETLRAVYDSVKYEVRMDAKYGKGMRPGFQIVEPERLWA